MKKLYYARQIHDVCFSFDEEKERDKFTVKYRGEYFIKEQDKWYWPEVEIQEIHFREEIPKGWEDGQLI